MLQYAELNSFAHSPMISSKESWSDIQVWENFYLAALLARTHACMHTLLAPLFLPKTHNSPHTSTQIDILISILWYCHFQIYCVDPSQCEIEHQVLTLTLYFCMNHSQLIKCALVINGNTFSWFNTNSYWYLLNFWSQLICVTAHVGCNKLKCSTFWEIWTFLSLITLVCLCFVYFSDIVIIPWYHV